MDDALQEIKMNLPKKENSFLQFFKKKNKEADPILKIAQQLITSQTSPDLENLVLSINDDGGEKLERLISLLLAIEQNNHITEFSDYVAERALAILKSMSFEVSKQSGDYPNNSIEGFVWLNGYKLRGCSNALVDFFEKRKMLSQKIEAHFAKCRITCSIMNHYPESVGPDMIDLGKALELNGNANEAVKYYKPVIEDFKGIAETYYQNIDEPLRDEDIISLRALIDAYEGVSRIENLRIFKDDIINIEVLLNTRKNGG